MTAEDPAGAYRIAAARAIAAHDTLLEANRSLGHHVLAPADVPLLRELVIRRIDVLPAFEQLVKLDAAVAREVLLDRWLGGDVDPDTRFGGFTFELTAMLDDLRQIAGEAALRAVIADPRIAPDRLADPRVLESLGQALDLAHDDVSAWIERARGSL